MIYEKMDSERYENESKIYKFFRYPQKGEGKFFNYRLLQPEEVPSWLVTQVSLFRTQPVCKDYCPFLFRKSKMRK